jgi:hypothetical protein
VIFREGSTLNVSRAGPFSAHSIAVATGSLGFLAASLFMFSSAHSIFEFNRNQAVYVGSQSWSWLQDVRFDVQKSKLPSDAEVMVGPQLPQGFVLARVQTDVIQKSAASPAVRPAVTMKSASLTRRSSPGFHSRIKTRLHRAMGALAKRQFPSLEPKVAAVILATDAAQPRKTLPVAVAAISPPPQASRVISPAVTSPSVSSVAASASDVEMDTFRKLHEGLRHSFLLAASTPHPVTTQIQIAATALAPVATPEAAKVTTLETAKPEEDSHWRPLHRKARAKHVAAVPASELIDQDLAEASQPKAAQEVPAAVEVAPESPQDIQHELKAVAVDSVADSIRTTRSAPEVEEAAVSGEVDNQGEAFQEEMKPTMLASAPTSTNVETPEMDSQPASRSEAAESDLTETESTPSEVSAAAEEKAAVQKPASVAVENSQMTTQASAQELPLGVAAARLWNEYSAKADAVPTHGGVITVSSQGQSRVLPAQSVLQANPATTPAVIHAATTPVVPAQSPIHIDALAMAPSVPAPVQKVSNQVMPLVEAFDWSTAVSSGRYSPFSQEASNQIGWGIAQATEHWSTLARGNLSAVPMISNNATKLLSAIAGTSLQAETGILFGKIPSGWNVRVSGRAEPPIVLNAQNQVVAPQNTDGERYFAFLNVAPGAHLVYLADRAGVEEGAVGVIALRGTSTYTDLTAISHTTLAGRVLDGAGETSGGLSKVTVRVLGNTSSVTQTDDHGHFSIPNVMTVSDYAVFLETDAADGNTHRYQIHPHQPQALTLYRLSASAIQVWLDQLEGSISPESGLVITALPSTLTKASASARIRPYIRSLSPSATLQPEVYTIDPTGQLEIDSALSPDKNRFISVQVPEGPALVTIADANQQALWSDLIVSSPGVVNLITPN